MKKQEESVKHKKKKNVWNVKGVVDPALGFPRLLLAAPCTHGHFTRCLMDDNFPLEFHIFFNWEFVSPHICARSVRRVRSTNRVSSTTTDTFLNFTPTFWWTAQAWPCPLYPPLLLCSLIQPQIQPQNINLALNLDLGLFPLDCNFVTNFQSKVVFVLFFCLEIRAQLCQGMLESAIQLNSEKFRV